MGFLKIGTKADGGDFVLHDDLSDKKIALLAQSKKGKTYGLGDILEELAEAQRPFIATDPANNLWGLRVLPDGRPSGLQVVVIGGNHADIPLEKDQGERMAELLLATPVCAVIDLALESGGTVKKFMADFATRLMKTRPDIPRVIVLEECPELIPQNAFGIQAQICKAAVAKLAVIGGNFNYGVIPACQRAATMDKNVLSQCEALIVMGMTHKKDRATVKEWMEAKDIGDKVAECFAELGSLQPGEAWYWNPGEDRFEKFTFRKRRTLHPREMQKLGLKLGAIKLGDMAAFVERARRELTKTVAQSPGKIKMAPIGPIQWVPDKKEDASEKMATQIAELEKKVQDLHNQLAIEKRTTADAVKKLDAVREQLRPQYDALRLLFDSLSVSASKGVDRSKYEKILAKAKSGVHTMVDYLLEHGEATRTQLATIAGVSSRSAYDYIYWMTKNGVARAEGKTKVVLCQL
jgi:hypothetical protein